MDCLSVLWFSYLESGMVADPFEVAPGMWRREDCNKFEGSLGYTKRSVSTWGALKDPVSKHHPAL